MAYEIVNRLKMAGNTAMLTQMELGVKGKDKEWSKKHEVRKRGFDIKECRTDEFIINRGNKELSYCPITESRVHE